ncbi:hypothetical protein BGW80DRAFT_1455496 [Lactifluus volemus]|nr:hypothetical protein BGW80DRAFT_1455496 [Lactifluus volemus]
MSRIYFGRPSAIEKLRPMKPAYTDPSRLIPNLPLTESHGSLRQSPLTFAPSPDFRFPAPVQALHDPGPALQVDEVPKPSYCPLFKMGLFLGITHRFGVAIEGVKLKLRKSKS